MGKVLYLTYLIRKASCPKLPLDLCQLYENSNCSNYLYFSKRSAITLEKDASTLTRAPRCPWRPLTFTPQLASLLHYY